LKLKCDILLSTSAFKFNLRCYTVVRLLALRREGGIAAEEDALWDAMEEEEEEEAEEEEEEEEEE